MARSFVKEVDKGWKDLLSNMRALESGGAHVKVGYLDDGREGSAQHDPESPLTNAMLAALMEFGSEDGSTPARPFISNAFENNRTRYVKDLGVLIGGIYERKVSVEQALGIMGTRMQNDIKRYVTTGAGVPPPNAPYTIARKNGKTRPLVNTSTMINALLWAYFTGKD